MWIVVAMVLIGTVAMALSPGPIDGLGPVRNLLGIEGVPNFDALLTVLSYALALVAAASLLLRFHRTRGVQRQQIKWFAYAGAVAAIGGVLTYIGELEATGVAWVRWLGLALVVVGVVGVPIAMGIAILRYRLYEIDIIINRTLVYSALTVVLASMFQAIDGALHYLLVTLAHAHSLPGSIIAALVVGVLFNPLRHRIQHFVDSYLPSEESGRPEDSEEANPS